MTKKVALKSLMAIMIVSAFISMAYIFGASWNPNAKAKNESAVIVSLDSVSRNTVVSVDYGAFHKVYIVNSDGNIKAYLFPYSKGKHYLPDLTWQRLEATCADFEASPSGFRCKDSELSEKMRRAAQWGLDGEALDKSWMPALEKAPFRVIGNEIIISPEYR